MTTQAQLDALVNSEALGAVSTLLCALTGRALSVLPDVELREDLPGTIVVSMSGPYGVVSMFITPRRELLQ